MGFFGTKYGCDQFILKKYGSHSVPKNRVNLK